MTGRLESLNGRTSRHTLSALDRYFGVLRGFSTFQAFDYNRSCRWMQFPEGGGPELETMRTDGT